MGGTKAVETDCKKQELFRLRGAGQRASVPSWALLSLSPHPHAVLSLALAGGSLLPLLNPGSGPQPSSSPLSWRGGRGASFGRRSCLPRWALGGVLGQTRPPTAPPQPGRVVGGAGESVGRGRGRVKARRSPPPEGVTAYKKGAALGTGAAGGGGAARLRRAQAVPASRASPACLASVPLAGTPGQNVGVQEEGPRPRP